MNKAKLFLTAIGVFAIVGGAVAFKAKSAFGAPHCYTTQLQADNKGCSLQDGLTPDVSGTFYYYVLKGTSTCTANRVCNTISRKFIED